VQGRLKSIEFVGEGQGHYDSLGVYVGVGDHDVVFMQSGTPGLLRRFEASWRADAAPGRSRDDTPASPLSRLWYSSQWLLQTSFSSRTSGSAASFWRELPQLLLAQKKGVALARHRIRLEVSSLPQARWLSPQIRVERERSEAQAYQNAQVRRVRDFYSLSLRSTATRKLTLEQEIQAERDEETDRLLGTGALAGTSGWRSVRFRQSEIWRPGAALTLRVGSTERLRDRSPGETRYEVYQVVEGVQWLPRDRARVDLQATRTWVRGPSARLLGLERAGWDGRATLGVQLRRWLDASVVADLHLPDEGAQRVSARAEMKAFF
jgi:hypothetical protein